MGRSDVKRRMRAMIVDDEPMARRTIRRLLARHGDVDVVGDCTGVDAEAMVVDSRPDVLFLDVQMPDMDGFSVLEKIGLDAVPAVVFVTAYDQHALRAFDVHAVDYLLKPFDDERFERTLQRVRDTLGGAEARARAGRLADLVEALQPPSRYVSRFVIRRPEKIVLVRTGEVDWIEAADYYVRLHTGSRSHLLRRTMSELEAALDPAQFFRIHRSAIVNLDRIRELQPSFRGEYRVVLVDGTELRMSRGKLEKLQERISR